MKVTKVTALKFALNNFGATVYDSRLVFLTGGESLERIRSGVHTLDLQSGTWKRNAFANFRNARACHVSITMGQNLYIFGGYGPNDQVRRTIEKLDIPSCKWDFYVTGTLT